MRDGRPLGRANLVYAAYVAFVGDGFRINLEHDWAAIFFRELEGVLFGLCDFRFDGWNSVSREKVLGFDFGQQRALRFSCPIDDLLGV